MKLVAISVTYVLLLCSLQEMPLVLTSANMSGTYEKTDLSKYYTTKQFGHCTDD